MRNLACGYISRFCVPTRTGYGSWNGIAIGCGGRFAALRYLAQFGVLRHSVNRPVAPPDAFEGGAFLQRLRTEYALVDLNRSCADIVRGYGDHAVAHVEPTRYEFAVGILEADFFAHARS